MSTKRHSSVHHGRVCYTELGAQRTWLRRVRVCSLMLFRRCKGITAAPGNTSLQYGHTNASESSTRSLASCHVTNPKFVGNSCTESPLHEKSPLYALTPHLFGQRPAAHLTHVYTALVHLVPRCLPGARGRDLPVCLRWRGWFRVKRLGPALGS